MTSDLEQRLRDALHEDAARARLVNPDQPADRDERSLPGTNQLMRSGRRLLAAAAAIVLLAGVSAVLVQHARDRQTHVSTSPDATHRPTSTTTEPVGTKALATAHDVVIGGVDGSWLAGRTLNVDAVEHDGAVTGEFRVDELVVTLQCADTDTIQGEIRLGGVVTADPDGQGVPANDDQRVGAGGRLALIIRERGPDFDQVMLYADERAGSCTELVENVPYNLDGGYFNDVDDGGAIETSGGNFNP